MLASPPVNGGLYPGGGQASLLRANGQQFLFNNQPCNAGMVSIAVELERLRAPSYPNGVSLQYWFVNSSGVGTSPGAYELDYQTSDTDSGVNSYVAFSKLTTGLNTTFVGRLEITNGWSKFCNVNLVSITTSGLFLYALVTR